LAQVRITLFSFSIAAAVVLILLIQKVFANPGGNPSIWIASLASSIFVVPNDLVFRAVVAPVALV